MSNKTRKWRSAIAMVLVICMLFSIFPTAAFAEDATPIKYVSLGASNTNGYGLRGYIPAADGDSDYNETMNEAALDSNVKASANVLGYGAETPGSYPVLVANGLGANLEQLAISSMRVEELRILLDNEYNGDAYSEWRFVGDGKWFDIATRYTNGSGGLDELREEYQDKIADADVITVDIGVNNFGVYISYQMTSDYRLDEDLAQIDSELAKKFEAGKAYVQELITEYAPEYSDMLLGMDDFVNTLAYALVGFCVNFDAVMERIYELNPDATVVAISIQNLMDGLELALPGVDETAPLGDLFAALINVANTYIAVGSPYADQYLCADVRQDGRVEFFLDDIIAYSGDPTTLDQNIIDCFNIYDGNPGVSYDSGLHVKYMVKKYLQNAGILSDSNLAIAEMAAYDVVASILQAAAKENVVDLSALAVMSDIEGALLEAILTEMVDAVTSSIQASAAVDYVLPSTFFSDVAEEANVSVSAVKTVAALAVRTSIGNSFFGHPNPDGHEQVANAVLEALENGTNGKAVIEEELRIALEDLKAFIVEYYDDAYAYAYDYAEENGYIDDATDAIDGVIDALKAIDLSGTQMTDAFKAEVAGEIEEIIETLEAAKALIKEADVLDQASLDALMQLLGEAGEMMTQLGTTLEQAGVDVAELVIVPALEEAYEVLMNEVVPAIIADLEEAIAEGTAWLMEKAQEAIDALVEALPEMAQFAHDYVLDFLLNNPEEVIAFFNEYGDDIINVVSEYGEYALAAMGYIAAEYGDEILAFVMENHEEILEVTAMLIEEHGAHAVELIQVYAEATGLCDMIQDEIDKIEDQIADLREQLEEELYKQLAELEKQLKDLYEQLENASEEAKAQIEAAIEAIEDVIAEVEAAIEAIEAAIADLEAQLAEAQKALEEAIAAVEAVVEAIKAAIENGVETVEEILAAIDAIVDFAEETIAGVQTAIEGIVNAAEDVSAFVEELIANGIVAAEMIEEIIDTVMDIIDGVKAELEKGDIEVAIEEIRNQLTAGYEELQAMLAAIDAAIAEQLDAIVGDLEAALAQAQDEFEEALYNATHGEYYCDNQTVAVYKDNTALLEIADKLALSEASLDEAGVILYQADPHIFVEAVVDGLQGDVPNWDTHVTDEEVLAYLEQTKADLVEKLEAEYGEAVAGMLEPVVDSLLFAVVNYAIINIGTIEEISAINEDALIVAVGMYNPVQGMTITVEGEIIDIEALCQYLIDVTDVYNLLYAMIGEKAIFVDVSDAETTELDGLVINDLTNIIELAQKYAALIETLVEETAITAAGVDYMYNKIDAAIEMVHNGSCPECEVKDIPVTGVEFEAATATMTTGSTLQLVANVLPENATNKAVTWESDDEDLITVDENGLVTSYSTTGSAYIIVTTEDGNYTAECEVTVEEKPIDYVAVTGVTLDEEAITLIAAGETQTLTATVEPSDATDKSVIWTSSNPEVATVVNGVVTAVANGEAIITVTTANGGYTDTCSVTVNIPTGAVTVPVTGVALDKDTLSLKVGNTAALTATVAPDNATNKAVTWASSNESVATVANGVVTAVAKGTATITVTTVDGSFTDTCAVTVTTSGGGSFGGGGGGGYIKPAKPEVIVPDNAVADGVTVTVDHIDYLTVNEVKDLVAKDDNLEVIGGRDSGALVAVKPANAVTSFAHPVQLTVPVSKSALQNVDDVNKLTLALVTTDAQGNIQLTYVGGNYDASKGTFTAYVNQPGKYVLMEKLDIVKLELTIDRYVVFVNGEPIINDVPSRIVNNRTIVPAARVLHHLGCTVEWIHDIRTVAVTLPDGSVLNMPVDEPIPGFGAAPMIENGRTLVPVAYIADMMDAHVQWVGNDRKVIIVK